jgi:hypothetical protein
MITREFREAYAPFLSGRIPTFASVLLGGALKIYGAECLEWDPLTLQLELKRDLDVEPVRVVYDQLNGLVTALTTDLVYHDVPTFDAFVMGVNRHGVTEYHDAPSVEDLAWAAAELLVNDPHPVGYPDGIAFGPQVEKYCAAILHDEGFRTAPTPLRWVKLQYPENAFNDDPELSNSIALNDRAMAEAVDQHIEQRLAKLFTDLATLGVKPNDEPHKR